MPQCVVRCLVCWCGILTAIFTLFKTILVKQHKSNKQTFTHAILTAKHYVVDILKRIIDVE